METVLFIAPHLSTGGLPQYLVKKVELLKDTYNIFVVEYDDITGGRLIIQKDRLVNLIGDKLITITANDSKQSLIDLIQKIKPYLIHFEEMPEYFMADHIAAQIYKPDREYKIFETCHDSSFNPDNKRFRPDKFVLVSKYQTDMLGPLNIPSEVVEYPIEYKERPDRTTILNNLGLDPSYKHVLHVGLFTPRKNQQEFFEYARRFENDKVIFHSIGNLADNFKFYWEPLLVNKPKNVIIHGEKNNVDDYYSAMDLFLFTSRGTVNDKETMPLVIREAISWNIPTLIYNLPVYQNYFDKFESVHYLNFDNFDDNVRLIDTMLPDRDKTVVIISAYPTTKSGIDLTLKSILSAKEHGFDVILTSHAKVSEKIQSAVDYLIYDSNNILTFHDYYNRGWFSGDDYNMELYLTGENNHIYHGPAVYTNYYNGIGLAKTLGYKNAICQNFDMNITDNSVYFKLISGLNEKKAVFNKTIGNEGNCLRTVMFATNIEFFSDKFKLITNDRDYNEWKLKVGSESNGLENMFYHTLKNDINEIEILTDSEFYDMLKHCNIDACSLAEYFTVLPTDNPNEFVIWYSTNNSVDNRLSVIQVIQKNGNSTDVILNERINILNETKYYKRIKYNGGEYKIILTEDGVHKKTILIDAEYITNTIKNNGKFHYTKPNKKINVVHLVTDPQNNEREQKSIDSIKSFANDNDIHYTQVLNEIYKDIPPTDNCYRPDDIAMEPGHMKLTPGHYGCYLAHKKGITLPENKDYDIIIVFEGDAVITEDHQVLLNKILGWSGIAKKEILDLVGFGNITTNYKHKTDDIFVGVSAFIPAHAYFINKERLQFVSDKLTDSKWDVFDLWVRGSANLTCGVTDKVYAQQISGYSLLDKKIKNKDNDLKIIYTN